MGYKNGPLTDDVMWPQRCCEAVPSAILARACLLVLVTQHLMWFIHLFISYCQPSRRHNRRLQLDYRNEKRQIGLTVNANSVQEEAANPGICVTFGGHKIMWKSFQLSTYCIQLFSVVLFSGACFNAKPIQSINQSVLFQTARLINTPDRQIWTEH